MKSDKKQVGIFGDILESLVIKFIAGLLKITPEQFKGIYDQLIPFIQMLLKLLGIGGTVKMMAFMAKNPKTVVRVMQVAMAEGE